VWVFTHNFVDFGRISIERAIVLALRQIIATMAHLAMGLAKLKIKYFLLLFLFCHALEAKPKVKAKAKSKSAPAKVVIQIKKPMLGHEKLVEWLEEQLPAVFIKSSYSDFDKNLMAFVSDFINKFSAIPSSISWEYFIQREKNIYPLPDPTLIRFEEIMLQTNFKKRVMDITGKPIVPSTFETLYFAYRIYLATLNQNLQSAAKGKAHIPIEIARDVFTKARKAAGQVILQHSKHHEILKVVSEKSIYLLGDFLLPSDLTKIPRKESDLLHNESIVKIDPVLNYAFEIYNPKPSKRTLSIKKYQLIGIESACAFLYQNGGKKYLVLAKDILAKSTEVPALEWSGNEIRYVRSLPKKTLGARQDFSQEELIFWGDERLKLLSFYRNDYDANPRRKSRIEAADESVKDGKFVDAILRDLNKGKDLNSLIQEKTNGLAMARPSFVYRL
jgi:hypothetical protein